MDVSAVVDLFGAVILLPSTRYYIFAILIFISTFQKYGRFEKWEK